MISFVKGEPAATGVNTILRNHRPPPSISASNLAEVVDWLCRVDGRDPELVRDAIELLIASGLEVEPVWLRVTWLAAGLRVEHYHRTRAAVSLADCVAIATAMTLETDLATTDPAQATVARAAGVDVIGLPDSEGRVP